MGRHRYTPSGRRDGSLKMTNHLGDPVLDTDIMSTVETHGIVLVSDAGLSDITERLGSLLEIYQHPHSSKNGWTFIRPIHSSSATEPDMRGFTTSELSLHTDRSFLKRPPALLFFVLLKDSHHGGQTLLVDTASIYRDFTKSQLTEIENELWLLDSTRSRRQQIFSLDQDLCISRYRSDYPTVPHATTRRAGDFLDELKRALKSPLRLQLRPGDGYLIHNHRILHGRTEFSGARSGGRLLTSVQSEASHSWLNRGFKAPLKID